MNSTPSLLFMCIRIVAFFLFIHFFQLWAYEIPGEKTDLKKLSNELLEKMKDHSVVIGKTPNAMTYYIKKHENSENKIKVVLMMRVGSIMERDDQLGLAHFVEHMGFNGVERFPGNEIVQLLEQEGVRFGADLNATTSYEATLFYITIPDDKPRLLSLVLDITKQWLHAMTYNHKEIEKEKGVVLEEVRAAEQPYRKAFLEMWDYLLEGTPYHHRHPGGKLDVIASAPREVIKSFYDTWYKPNLSAIAVVGDVEVEEIRGDILSRFSYEDSFQKHPDYDFPLDEVGSFQVQTIPVNDPQATPIGVFSFREHVPENKEDFFFQSGINSVVQAAVNHRLQEVVKESTYFSSASYSHTLRGRRGVQKNLFFEPRPGQFKEGYQELVMEIEKLRRWGIDQEEFDGMLTKYINSLKSTEWNNEDWLSSLYEHFVYGEVVISPKSLLNFLEEIREGKFVTLEQVNTQLKTLGLNTGIRFAALHASNVTLPSESYFREYYQNASFLSIEEKKKVIPIDHLLSKEKVDLIKRGEARIEKKNNGYVIYLENEIKVYFKPLVTTDKKISLWAQAHNQDSSPYTKNAQLRFNFRQTDGALNWVGLGGYDYRQLSSFFSTHSLEVNYSLDPYIKTLKMTAPTDDMESLFQTLYLIFTDLNYYSPLAEKQFRNRVADWIDVREQSDSAYLTHHYEAMVFPNHPFKLSWDDYQIKNFDPELTYQILKESLNNVGDFTFYISGDIEVEVLTYLLKKYVASLPHSPPSSPNNMSSGITIRPENLITYERGQGQSIVIYGWVKNEDQGANLKERLICSLIGEALSNLLLREIREKESGVYSVNASMFMHLYPSLSVELQVSFATHPERTKELIEKSKKLVTIFSQGEIDSEIMESVRKTLTTTYNEYRNSLPLYNSMMSRLEAYGEDPLRGHEAYLQVLEEIEDEEIFTYLEEYLQETIYFQVVQEPLGINR